MRSTLAHAARLLSETSAASRLKGANLSYELCLARCVAPITPNAQVTSALGRDYVHLGAVLRRLGRALRTSSSDRAGAELVIASARALAAVAALLVFAQRCDVDIAALSAIAAPLRERCAPALLVPLLATDLRVVAAARDALDQIVLLRVAHSTPWLDVLLAVRAFRLHHISASAVAAAREADLADQDDEDDDEDGPSTEFDDPEKPLREGEGPESLLSVVLARSSALLRSVFVEIAAEADAPAADPDPSRPSSPQKPESPDFLPDESGRLSLRRRTSISTAAVRLSHASSWHVHPPSGTQLPRQGQSHSAPRRAKALLRALRNKVRPQQQLPIVPPCGACGVCLHCSDTMPNGLRFPARRKSLDGMADSASGSMSASNASELRRMPSNVRRRRKRMSGMSVGVHSQGSPQEEGRGVSTARNRDVAAGMHIFERLLSRVLLPSLKDRALVIEELRALAEPLYNSDIAVEEGVDADILRRAVASAFTCHGSAIYSALLGQLFRPARREEDKDDKTNKVKRHLSLGPVLETAGSKSDSLENWLVKRKPKRFRTTIDMSEHIGLRRHSLGHTTDVPEWVKSERNIHADQVCLPNSDCDVQTAQHCMALLSLLVEHVPDLCKPRLALITGATNTAYWHCAEALVREETPNGVGIPFGPQVSWSIERLLSAVDSLRLLVSSLPRSPGSCIDDSSTPTNSDMDTIIEACMRSVCATGCRLARIDARKSAPVLSDNAVVQAGRAWIAFCNLPTGSLLWPSGPAYSSAIVYVAHLARRAALAVYYQRRLQEIDMMWQQRHGLAMMSPGTDPGRSSNTLGADASMDWEAFRGMEGIQIAAFPGDAAKGRNAADGKKEDNSTMLVNVLQDCIAILVQRNGSNVVVHDLFRTLLYILSCEMRGDSTRAALCASKHDSGAEPSGTLASLATIPNQSLLPTRAPMFSGAAHSPPSKRPRDNFTAVAELQRSIDVEVGARIHGINLDSLAVDNEENDVSGLLVGNIAVDGDRDIRLREIAAQARGKTVAHWFRGLAPPALSRYSTTSRSTFDLGTRPEDLVGATFASPMPKSNEGFPMPECSPLGSRGSLREIDQEVFEEIATAVALVLNAVSTSAATEGEDLGLPMQIVAQDVSQAHSLFVTQLHSRALTLVKQSKLGNAQSIWNPASLVRQMRDLQAEVAALRADMECLRASVDINGDEHWRKFRWPLRSSARSNADATAGSDPASSQVQRASGIQ